MVISWSINYNISPAASLITYTSGDKVLKSVHNHHIILAIVGLMAARQEDMQIQKILETFLDSISHCMLTDIGT